MLIVGGGMRVISEDRVFFSVGFFFWLGGRAGRLDFFHTELRILSSEFFFRLVFFFGWVGFCLQFGGWFFFLVGVWFLLLGLVYRLVSPLGFLTL